VARGKPLAQAKTIHCRWRERGEAPQRRGNEINLFHISTAVSAGREMQDDLNFGQTEKAVIQILRGSIHDIAATESAAGPL
jgi:hypothetical protein